LPGEGGNVEAEGLRHRSKAGVDARVELKRIDDQRGVDVEEIGRRGDPAEQPCDGRLTSIAENVTASRKADETFTGLDSDVRRDQRGCRCPARSRRESSDHL